MSVVFDELTEWVGFGPEDSARLQARAADLLPALPQVSELFYAAIDANPEARAVITDEAQRDRLKRTLVIWMQQLLVGPHDEVYFTRRIHIGKVHVRVGLPQRYVMTAMNVMRIELERLAIERFPDAARAFSVSMSKLMDIELAIMLQSYIDERTHDEITTFRSVVFSHLPISAFVLDENLVVVDGTPRHRPILSRPDVIGIPFLDIFTEEFLAASDLKAQTVRCQKSRDVVVLPRIDLATGEHAPKLHVRSYRVTLLPLNQRFASLMVHIEDHSDAIQSESRRSQEENLIRLGTMAATVAHEIRNPLAGISAAIQVVRNSLDEGDGRRLPLQRVNEQVARLGDLVGDLLDFSRPIRAESRHLDLRAVVDQVVPQYPSTSGVIAKVDGRGSAIADAALLIQSLGNLVSNAWQAEAKTVHISIEDARILIDDDGPGIPPEVRAKIFEPFFTTKVRGTGLGLPQVKKAVEQMGGAIRLVDDAPQGTRFEIALMAPRSPATT